MGSGWLAEGSEPLLARLWGCCCRVAEVGQPRCKLTLMAPLQL